MLYNSGFFKEAQKLDDSFNWGSDFSSVKLYLKNLDLPSDIKNKVFLILNDKAYYFESEFEIKCYMGMAATNIYLGFNLMKGKI